MSEAENNGYPAWIKSVFKEKNTCGRCGCMIGIEDIVSIGLYTPNEIADSAVGPQPSFDTRCPDCGHLLRYSFDIDLPLLFDGISEFSDLITKYRMDETRKTWVVLPSPNYKKRGVPKHNPEFGLHEARIKRVRRNPALQQMPTDKEVQVFLNKLERASFKRSSKGFKRFMAELRVDLDAPEKGGKS